MVSETGWLAFALLRSTSKDPTLGKSGSADSSNFDRSPRTTMKASKRPSILHGRRRRRDACIRQEEIRQCDRENRRGARNVIFERATFKRRSKGPGESVEHFITSLYNLADSCEYGNLQGEMNRDRIVVGIRDRSLSERLQIDVSLTCKVR